MEIWLEIRKDQESGTRRLVSEYGDRLFAAAVLLCRNDDDAEELVFRTLDQAVRKIGQYRPTSDFFNWLYTILLNFYRMGLRKKRIDCIALGTPQELPEPPAELPGESGDADGYASLRLALQELNVPLREVVTMRYFLELSVDEISRKLSLPIGTVKSRLHKARTVLYAVLSKQEGD